MPVDRKAWLEERRQGIGGSDAPTIYLGDYYGRTWHDLWSDKVHGDAVEIDSPDIRRGNRQEPIAAEVYVEESGHPVEVVEEIIRHPVHDFMAASLDRMIQPEGIPLEIKCPRVATFFRWKQQGIPAGPLLQGQHYMAVLEVKQNGMTS